MRCCLFVFLLLYGIAPAHAQMLETRMFKPLYFGGDIYESHADSTFTFTDMVILLHGRDTLYCDKMVQKNSHIDLYNARLVSADGIMVQSAHMVIDDKILYGKQPMSTAEMMLKRGPAR